MNATFSFRSIAASITFLLLFALASCGGGASSPPGGGHTVDNSPTPGNYLLLSGGAGPSLFVSPLDRNGAISAATNASSTIIPRDEYPSFAVGSTNRFVYALDTILPAARVFSITGPGLKLSEVAAPITTAWAPWSVCANPAETFLYVTEGRIIEVFSISSKGVLMRNHWEQGFEDVREAVITSSGKFLFASDASYPRIYGFQIGPDGSLTAIQGSPFPVAAGSPRHIVIDSSGKYLYAGITDGHVAGFAIDATSGALTNVSGSPFTTSGSPIGMVASSSFIYISSQNGMIDGFQVASDGTLTPVPGSPFGPDTSASSIAVDSTGQFLYVANGSSSLINGFKIDSSTGRLTVLGGSPFMAVSSPSHLVPLRIP